MVESEHPCTYERHSILTAPDSTCAPSCQNQLKTSLEGEVLYSARCSQFQPRIVLSLFFCLLVTYGYFFQSGQHNEDSRYDQMRAVLEDHSLKIDRFAWNTADVVVVNHHVYPNKAPGLTFAALPIWFLSKAALQLFGLHDYQVFDFAAYLTSWLSVGLASALLGVLLFLVLEVLTENRYVALLLTLCYSLGSIAFPFATLFFSHQFTAALLFAAFSILFFFKEDRFNVRRCPVISALITGLLLGYAVITEYPAAIAIGPIGLYGIYVFSRRGERILPALLLFVMAGLLPLLGHLYYNHLAFERLLFTSYSPYLEQANPVFKDVTLGYQGVQLPALLAITFLPARGLFFCNPWLLALIPGIFFSLGARRFRLEYLISVVIVLGFFAFNAGFGVDLISWGGGTSTGPRYISAMIPFATLCVASFVRFWWSEVIVGILGLLSIAVMLMATATEPRVAYEYINPVRDLFLRSFLDGELSQEVSGPFHTTLLTHNSVAFNLGKLIGLPEPLQFLPLFIIWGILLWQASRYFRIDEQRALRRGGCGLMAALFAAPFIFGQGFSNLRASGNGLLIKYVEGASTPECPETLRRQIFAPPFSVEPDLVKTFTPDTAIFHGNFTASLSGYLHTPERGLYHFATISDDGSCLYLNGKLVVDNGGTHAVQRHTGSVMLPRGLVPIDIRYYNRVGAGLFSIYWAPPGSGYRLIPSYALVPASAMLPARAQ